MVASRGELGFELVGQLSEVMGGEAHGEPWLTSTGVSRGHGAGLAGGGEVAGIAVERDATRLRNEGTDGGLLLLEAVGGHEFGEVLDGVEFALTCDDTDAHDVHLGVEQVGTVLGRVHPHVVDLDCAGGFGDVLADEAEGHTHGCAATAEAWFAGKLVGDGCVRGHRLGVLGGGPSELRVTVQQRQTARGALLVGSGEQILLGDGGSVRGVDGLLRKGAWQEEQNDCQRQLTKRRCG